ncbi:MAG TPA: hypothetical protein VKO43_05125, partial [Candidatus Krumholzibacteriaceae bacterium]|nr:hypothetical protein [Candidatus Krumholzibacteriaceae bacterium]
FYSVYCSDFGVSKPSGGRAGMVFCPFKGQKEQARGGSCDSLAGGIDSDFETTKHRNHLDRIKIGETPTGNSIDAGEKPLI